VAFSSINKGPFLREIVAAGSFCVAFSFEQDSKAIPPGYFFGFPDFFGNMNITGHGLEGLRNKTG